MQREIGSRRQQQSRIREQRDDYIRIKYGIANFSELVEEHLGSLGKEYQCTGLLCRHIASPTMEALACYYVCRAVGLSPAAVELVCDGFQLGKNPEKLALVKQLWVYRSTKGNLVSHYRRPCNNGQALTALEHRPFRDIVTDDGIPLVELHHQYHQQVFSDDSYPFLDVSAFFAACLDAASHKPETVFVQCTDGYETEVNYHRLRQGQMNARDDKFSVLNVRNQLKTVHRALAGKMRPPARWYYLLYLSLFLDGTFVLLESFDDPSLDGKVPEIFHRTMDEIRHAVGHYSLVIEVPCTKEMSHYPQRIIENGLGAVSVSINGEDDLAVLFRQVTDALCGSL